MWEKVSNVYQIVSATANMRFDIRVPLCVMQSFLSKIINIQNIRDALAVTVLGCNPIFPAEIYEKRSTGSLLHWENNPFWDTEDNREVDDKIIILQEESGT